MGQKERFFLIGFAKRKLMQWKLIPCDAISYEWVLIIDGSRLLTRVLRIDSNENKTVQLSVTTLITCGSCIKLKSHVFIRTLPAIVMIWFYDRGGERVGEETELERFEEEQSIKDVSEWNFNQEQNHKTKNEIAN